MQTKPACLVCNYQDRSSETIVNDVDRVHYAKKIGRDARHEKGARIGAEMLFATQRQLFGGSGLPFHFAKIFTTAITQLNDVSRTDN